MPDPHPIDTPAWRAVLANYETPSAWRSGWQLANTLVPYAGLWYLMYLAQAISIWLALPLAILAGGFLVRLFIIFHDCGHRSFFKSRQANEWLGFLLGVLTFTPFHQWRWEHAMHHGSAGNLDKRGIGDIWTLTVQEYLEASRWKRFAYRLARNPVVLFVLAPLFLFVVWQRFPSPRASRRDRYSVYWTNLAILTTVCIMSAVFGIESYAFLQLSVIGVGASAGVWLFYVQHQFEGVYWQRHGEWDYTAAALQGSSFYKLPQLLQWFSGNIGFHHIHHLSSRIPNYNLGRCYKAEPLMQAVKPVTLLSSFKSFTFRLWDEQRCKLVGFDILRTLRRQHPHQSMRC
ncbi:MAG: fatty acid desaturase [Lentisphaerae bacterium]|nr:fatty acid desaturase [Lentisphaerota bacterium]